MGLRWYFLRSRIASFFTRHGLLLRRLYWFCIVTIVVLIFAIPIGMGIRNPHVQLLDTHGVSPAVNELIREWNIAVAQARREQGRLNDFAILVNHISENYPFLSLMESHNGVNYIELALTVFDELAEVARYEVAPGFLSNFLNERYISLFDGYGGLRLTGRIHTTAGWLTQPYFFNYYDWRFYDDRHDIPVHDGNVVSEILVDGMLYVRINNFLPKGYELITRNPFWYFCFDVDKQYLMDLFINLYSVDDLIIDIRGIGAGFRDYFIPLVLAPFLVEPANARFYAFHANAGFANRVSQAYRDWYGFREAVAANLLTRGFAYGLPENVTQGFPIDIAVQSAGDVEFEGRIWLLTDSDNFSGPNFAYLQIAADAGFTIIYDESLESIGWDTSFTHLPYSGISVRFNPLYFTDITGRSFEEMGAIYDYRLYSAPDILRAVLAMVDEES